MSKSISRRDFMATAGAGLAAASVVPAAQGTPLPAEGILPVRPLGLTGLMPTLVGFGGGSQYLKIEDMDLAERMLHRAFELGVRYYDTAHSYTVKGKDRESIKRFGRFLVPSYRKDIILVSKVGARDAETARRQIEETFNDLKTDYLDILHFHSIGSTEDIDQITADGGALRVFRDLKDSGAVRVIGLTGHADSRVLVDAMKRIEPEVVMCPQNPGHGNAGRGGAAFTQDVLPYAVQHGIGVMAMKTTGQNGLIGQAGVTAAELVRYAMSLPVAGAVIGMPSLEVLESCAEIARTLQPMTLAELEDMRGRMMAAVEPERVLPYLTPGYVDGGSVA